MMKSHLLLLFLFCFNFMQAQVTEIKYLSGKGSDDAVEWNFFCTKGYKSGSWNKIKVPSCWETEGYGTYNYGHDKNKAYEQGLYKTQFQIPKDWKSKRIFIVFEGAMTDTEIKVNGKQAGSVHQGAFYRFKREITSLVRFVKSNDLDVKVSKMSANKSINEAEREADFWVFGGIFRPVYLEAVPNEYIEYTAIDARHTGDVKADVILSGNLSDIEA
jgi:beta-galactosidase/beta-glucuronidase